MLLFKLLNFIVFFKETYIRVQNVKFQNVKFIFSFCWDTNTNVNISKKNKHFKFVFFIPTFQIWKFQVSQFKFSNYIFKICKMSNCTARLPVWSTKKHNVATELISDKIYGEILFQKVASGYLLHFVQDGSSKNALEN